MIMTREDIEQLNVVEPYCFETASEEIWYRIGCIEGLNAADKEPNTSALWHEASEEPQENMDILCVSKNGKVRKVSKIVNHFYNWLKDNNSIVKWAYITDLLPKGGEK